VLAKLPSLTAEIGDTWAFGAASDPLRLQIYREMMRRRAACLNVPSSSTLANETAHTLATFAPADEPIVRGCNGSTAAWDRFDRLFLKFSEHTQGEDSQVSFFSVQKLIQLYTLLN
jgi:hypothetical protein